MAEVVLDVRGLVTQFLQGGRPVHAVDGVSFDLRRGEILGLVGESGSGKSVTGFSIMGLIEKPGRIVAGEIVFAGRDIARLPHGEMRKLRGNRIAMIFQDPMMTLNPVLRVDTQMIEAVVAHDRVSRRAARARCLQALAKVGIPAPEERLVSYPHQLSGGMRQRVAIAIALLHAPDVIIADEPTTALDVTIQAQILYEVQALVRETGTALVWISHDLAVVGALADRLAVMYAGRIVEQGETQAVLARPAHRYTQGLLASIPSATPRGEVLQAIPGTTPSPADLPPGCAFAPRCRNADDACRAARPALTQLQPGRWAACVHPAVEGAS